MPLGLAEGTAIMAQESPTGTASSKAPEKEGTAAATTPTDPWGQFFKNLPASETKPLSGATTVKDGAGYPGELVAFSLLNDVTSSIATAVSRAKARHVLVVEDRALLDSEWEFLSVTSRLAAIRDRLEKAANLLAAAPPEVPAPSERDEVAAPSEGVKGEKAAGALAVSPVAAAVAALPKIVGGVADIVGMFRTNYAMASRTMSPEGTPVAAQVANILLSHADGVAVSIDGFATIRSDSSKLLEDLDQVRGKRQQLEIDSVPLRDRVAKATSAIATLSEDRKSTHASLLKVLAADEDGAKLKEWLTSLDGKIAGHQTQSAHHVATLAVIDAAVAAYDGFETAIRTEPSGGRPPLLSALAREQLHRPDGPSHVLFVSVDSVGADVATPASQLANTDFVHYFGGIQVSYLLYEVSDGKVVAAEVERRLASARLDLKSGQLSRAGTSELR